MSTQSSAAVEQAADAFLGVHRRLLIVIYVILYGIAVFSALFVGFWKSLVILCAYILLILPLFTFRGETTFVTDEPPTTVTNRLNKPENVLTAVWFARADEIEANPTEHSVVLWESPRIGSERRYRIETERVDETTIRQSVLKGENELVTTTIEVHPTDSGSEVRTTTHRSPITLLWLSMIPVLGYRSNKLLSAAGFRVVESSWGVQPRNPFSRR